MYSNGATIMLKRMTSRLLNKTHRVQRRVLPVFYGVGRGSTSRVTLVLLAAVGASLITVTATTVFGWFVNWT